jgi:hypothetical protein
MLVPSLFFLALGLNPHQYPALLSKASRLVLPVYPRLAKSAHDSRRVIASIRINGGKIEIIEIHGGNKYFDESVRIAISKWIIPSCIENEIIEFAVTFEYAMTDSKDMDGVCELFPMENRIVIWALKRYTDTEKLPIMENGGNLK